MDGISNIGRHAGSPWSTSSARCFRTRSVPSHQRSLDEYPVSYPNLSRHDRMDTHLLSQLARPLELDPAVDEREQRMIAPDTNVRARPERRSALPDENGTGPHGLAVTSLHTQP